LITQHYQLDINLLNKNNMKKYPKEVIEIHNEFNNAGDKLLATVLEILNTNGEHLILFLVQNLYNILLERKLNYISCKLH